MNQPERRSSSSRRLRRILVALLVVAVGPAIAGCTAIPAATAPSASSSGTPRADSPTAAPSTGDYQPLTDWPDETNTGVVGCPPLQRVDGPEVVLRDDGVVYENKEVHEAVIRVLAKNVTIRCVKVIGIGYFGIDNTERATATGVTVDRVEIDCQDKGLVVGMLLKSATVTRANVHSCDHMMNAGGNDVVVKDSFCHDLSKVEGKDIHADCFQSLGGNTNLTLQHNAFWGWDTSDILLGQEYGEAKNVVIENNRLMSDPDQEPPPAFLIYLSGTNTKVTNNRFTRRYTYGPCTLNTKAANITFTGNVWDDDGSPVGLKDCK